jgi:Methyltransferase domain
MNRRSLRGAAVRLVAKGRRATWHVRPGEKSLDQLALAHGADKSSAGHDFAGVYETYLEPRRYEPITVLEIGIWRGASLRTWRDYFPNGRIVGVDVNPAAAAQRGERIDVFVGGQEDAAFLAKVIEVVGPPDLVVDDGAHRAELQFASLEFLWPLLRRGGLYVVEDTQTSYLEQYGMGWREPGSTIERLKALVDDVHAGFHDRPVRFEELEFVHFYPATCLLGKSSGPRRSGLRARIDAAAARDTGAWTG